MRIRPLSQFLIYRKMGWISGSARRVSHRTAQAKTWSLVGAVESSLLVVAQRVKPVSQVSGPVVYGRKIVEYYSAIKRNELRINTT